MWAIGIPIIVTAIVAFIGLWAAINAQGDDYSVPQPKTDEKQTKFNGAFWYKE